MALIGMAVSTATAVGLLRPTGGHRSFCLLKTTRSPAQTRSSKRRLLTVTAEHVWWFGTTSFVDSQAIMALNLPDARAAEGRWTFTPIKLPVATSTNSSAAIAGVLNCSTTTRSRSVGEHRRCTLCLPFGWSRTSIRGEAQTEQTSGT